ncbi:MAG TPA: fructose-6-phosphate aldolase [Candidatus Polarisedimenticolaceae bacterium]|nr:fructose-6-phosphate aldolase [Candidatus Polarisedimenticolaceae bacterium]
MKFFIDTANLDEIREAARLGILDGVTTNPSLVAKEGRKFEDVIREITTIVDGPISAEVTALDYDGMMAQAAPLAKIHKNVTIKVPLTKEGLRACKALRAQGIHVNVTLCFSPSQALLAAKCDATFISPFVGRLDDISHEGMDLIRQIRAIYDNYGYTTQILAASIRHPLHVVDSALAGADVGTMPFKVMMQLYEHPLTENGLKKFLEDWAKLKA